MKDNNDFVRNEESSQAAQKTKEQWLAEGSIHLEKGNYQEALAAFNSAIMLESDFAEAYTMKSKVLMKLGQYKEAAHLAKQASMRKQAFIEKRRKVEKWYKLDFP